MKKTVFLIVCCLLLCLPVAVCHPGRTDENGGHYDHSTGEYHYHHGFPAHRHINGICPYDFVDRTGAGSSGGGTVAAEGISPAGDGNSSPVSETGMQETTLELFLKAAAGCGILFLICAILASAVRWIQVWKTRKTYLPPYQGQRQSKPDGLSDQAKEDFRGDPSVKGADNPGDAAYGVHAVQSPGAVYRDLYEGRSIWELAGVPDGVYFDTQDLPHTQDCQCEEDPFVVWASANGGSYHRPGCRMAGDAAPVNICLAIRSGKCACKVCTPMERLPTFVEQYQRLRRIQRDYGIQMLP